MTDHLFTITCGHCGSTSPLADWKRTLAGELPPDAFQCPKCRTAFRREALPNRKPWEKCVRLVPMQGELV